MARIGQGHVKIRFSLGLVSELLAVAGSLLALAFLPAHCPLCKCPMACQKRLLMVLNVVKYLSSFSVH